ncbi:hypothetical protein, partial [Streptomyces montanus]|uniref:hypothetical protein n=1 Tax=Streptomyces montanus TaxID=2580423 RepID=UPI001FEBAEC0
MGVDGHRRGPDRLHQATGAERGGPLLGQHARGLVEEAAAQRGGVPAGFARFPAGRCGARG